LTPFVTEALWPHVSAARGGSVVGVELPASELLINASWPVVDESIIDQSVIADFERADRLAAQIRSLRAAQGVKPKQRIALHAPVAVLNLITQADGYVEALAGIGEITPSEGRPPVASPIPFEGEQVFLSGLTDEIDLTAERTRIEGVIAAKSKQIAGFEAKLSNAGYIKNAKPELVAETREKLAAATADLEAAQAARAALGDE
jgi:valyl-tRNA synthetase